MTIKESMWQLAKALGHLRECKVCWAVPDSDGAIEHGRGCYTQSQDGGGLSFEEVVNYVGSEWASAMLLEAMPEPELFLESSKSGPRKLWACWADMSADTHSGYALHYDRRIAVFLSALRWKNIEEPKDFLSTTESL